MVGLSEEAHGVNGEAGKVPLDSQPPSSVSIYTSPPVTVRIGGGGRENILLQAIVDQYQGLKERLRKDELFSAPSIDLPEVDEEVGHTLLHYLYTRQYEVLGLESLPEDIRAPTEFKRSVLTYCAAKLCGVTELEELTKAKVEALGKSLSIFNIQQVAEDVSPKLPENTDWFSGQMGKWIKAALQNDDALLRDNRLVDIIGRTSAFDKGVVKGIAELYTELKDNVHRTSAAEKVTAKSERAVKDGMQESLPNGTGEYHAPEDISSTRPRDIEARSEPVMPTEAPARTSKANLLAVDTTDSNEAVVGAKNAAAAPEEYSPMPSEDGPGSPFSPPVMEPTTSRESNEKTPATESISKIATDQEEAPKSKAKNKKKKKGKRADSFGVQAVGVPANGGE